MFISRPSRQVPKGFVLNVEQSHFWLGAVCGCACVCFLSIHFTVPSNMLSQLYWLRVRSIWNWLDKQYISYLWQSRFQCLHFVKVENLLFRKCAGEKHFFVYIALYTLTIDLILKSSAKTFLELCGLSNARQRQWNGFLWNQDNNNNNQNQTRCWF